MAKINYSKPFTPYFQTWEDKRHEQRIQTFLANKAKKTKKNNNKCLHADRQLVIWGPNNGVYNICTHCGKKHYAIHLSQEERSKLVTVWPQNFDSKTTEDLKTQMAFFN